MHFVVRKLSDGDKKKMIEASDEVIDVIQAKLGKDRMLIIQTLDFLRQSFMEENSIHAIKAYDEKGSDAKFGKLSHMHTLLTGLANSSHNVVLFRDCAEVWMQYHAARFLKMPVYIIALEKHRKALAYTPAEHIEFINADDYDGESLQKAMNKVSELMKG